MLFTVGGLIYYYSIGLLKQRLAQLNHRLHADKNSPINQFIRSE